MTSPLPEHARLDNKPLSSLASKWPSKAHSHLLVVQVVTLMRAIGAIIFVTIALTPQLRFWSLMAYILAALSDLVDGYLARRLHVVSRLGGALDLFGDKFLTLCSVLYAAAVGVSPLPCSLIVLREILLASLRSVKLGAESIVPPTRYIGAATVLPIRVITAVLLLDGATLDEKALDLVFWLLAIVALTSLIYRLLSSWARIVESLRRDVLDRPNRKARLIDEER